MLPNENPVNHLICSEECRTLTVLNLAKMRDTSAYEAPREMKAEAAAFGFAAPAHGHLPRLKIASIADWFIGSRPALPSLRHVSRDYFEPEKSPRRKKAAAPNPNAPQFTFTFPSGTDDSAVVHFNPLD
ncbi:hypothetical protein [Rhizobium gallicum]|uniref:hypothetical protein n=1 Tax=Rhizobium gallicum TaxID=56730 RepID=UPI001EF99F21|nr:hypothetical protein [Rhizobium gallicum]ULJ74470.1 hypothetical protein L2W42_21715 [Rhizobium gallicum]